MRAVGRAARKTEGGPAERLEWEDKRGKQGPERGREASLQDPRERVGQPPPGGAGARWPLPGHLVENQPRQPGWTQDPSSSPGSLLAQDLPPTGGQPQ